MRILALDLGAEWRGGQGQTLLVSSALARRGNDVAVAARAGSPLSARVASRNQERLSLVPVRAGSEAAPGVLLDVARAVRSFRPDVLWAGDARSHGAVVWSRAVRRHPLAVHRRVVFPPSRSPLSRLKYRKADLFLVVSSAAGESLVAAGVPRERVVHLPDGLPPSAFVDAPPPPSPPFRLAHVGSFDGKKGQEIVVDVVAALATEMDVEALFLGDGPKRAEMAERARRAGVLERCRFAGVVSDVSSRIAACHLLLLPSESEGASLALLEAMAAGCPVMTHEVGGAREVVDGGSAGALLPNLDPAEWTAATRALLLDEPRRRRYVEAGRRLVSSRTVERTAEELEKQLAQLVARRGGGS